MTVTCDWHTSSEVTLGALLKSNNLHAHATTPCSTTYCNELRIFENASGQWDFTIATRGEHKSAIPSSIMTSIAPSADGETSIKSCIDVSGFVTFHWHDDNSSEYYGFLTYLDDNTRPLSRFIMMVRGSCVNYRGWKSSSFWKTTSIGSLWMENQLSASHILTCCVHS